MSDETWPIDWTRENAKGVNIVEVIELPLCAGWTVGLRREGGHIYLHWYRTGSQDPHLSHLSPDEAVDLANILLGLALDGEGEARTVFTPNEAHMIRMAVTDYHEFHGYVPDEPIVASILSRIPEPDPKDVTR